LWPVGGNGGAGPHCADHHHGLGRRQNQAEQKGGFFKRVGAMGDDHPGHVRISKRRQRAGMELAPDGFVHVTARHVGDLFAGNPGNLVDPRQRGNQIVNGNGA
jgi:hypothetical protein